MEEAEGALSLGAVGTSEMICSEKNEAHKHTGESVLSALHLFTHLTKDIR